MQADAEVNIALLDLFAGDLVGKKYDAVIGHRCKADILEKGDHPGNVRRSHGQQVKVTGGAMRDLVGTQVEKHGPFEYNIVRMFGLA